MNVVVVSNRVARAKPDEPLAGGLAAALLPMVRDSGAIWVGSNGPSSDTTPSHDFLPKWKRSALARSRPSTCRPNTIAAFTKASPIRRCGRRCIRAPISSMSPRKTTSPTARSTLSWHELWCASIRRKRYSGFRTIIEDRQNFEDSSCAINVVDGTAASHWGLTQLASRPFPDRHRRRGIRHARDQGDNRQKWRGCAEGPHGAACLSWAWIASIIRRDLPSSAYAPLTACSKMPGLTMCHMLLAGRRAVARQYQSHRRAENGTRGPRRWRTAAMAKSTGTPVRYINKGFSQLTLAGFYEPRGPGDAAA